MNTYIVVLTNGEKVSVKAEYIQYTKNHDVEFHANHGIVGRINMANVVGWIKAEGEKG